MTTEPARRPHRRGRRPAPVVAALAVAALLAGSCSRGGAPDGDAPATAAPTAGTIDARPPGPATPGQLIDATPIAAPEGLHAWRLSYVSRDAAGRDIAVTGLLVSPADAPAGLPIITYGHPTTGSADSCVPSRQGLASVPTPRTWSDRGWAFVMSDYPGLGTSDPHPYLVGAAEGQSVLDAARAARGVAGSGVTAASPVGILGFSQGGHAAAFAGELAPTYAPDLDVKGVAVAAPVSDVTHFARRAEGMPDQLGVLVTIVGGFASAYPELDPGTVFTDQVEGELGELERRCIGEMNDFFDRPIDEVVRQPATALAPFQARFAENQAGRRPLPVPALVVQGSADPIVDPADSDALVRRWCALGVPVQEVVREGAGHGVMADQPYADWLAARFAGQAPATTC